MAKRILIFSLNYYPFVGGAEVAIKEITDRIGAEDIEFHLLTLRQDSSLPKEEHVGNVIVHRIGLALPHPDVSALRKLPLKLNVYYYQLFAAYLAGRLHRRYRFDGIWAMMAHATGIPAGLFKKHHPDVGYLLTLQEGDPPEYIEGLMHPVRHLFAQGFKKADALQAISTFLARWGTRMGFPHEPIVVPNGVDTAHFSRSFSDAEVAGMKEALGKREGDIFLVTTSRLVHKNAIDDVIRALPLLPEHISFLIYGIGPEEDALRKLAQELGVTNRARFMGQISHEAMPLMLAACDIFVRPSRSEGMGNSFIEAMAAGLPVVATQEGGISDFLFDAARNPDRPTTGWAVDKNQPRQIASAIEEILSDSLRTREIIDIARTIARENYDWKLIAERMETAFSRIATHIEKPRRVVVATPLYPPELGGPATYARLLEQGLPTWGIEIEIIKFRDVLAYPKGVRHLAYFWKVLRATRKGDIVLALDPVSVGLAALWAARMKRATFSVKIVGDYAWEQGVQRFGIADSLDNFVHRREVPFGVALLRYIERHVANGARVVIVPSEYLKGIVRAWGVTSTRIEVVYNAIELETGGKVPGSFAQMKEPVVVTAGRLVPWKRVGGIIDGVAAAPKSLHASLVVVGDGPNRGMLEMQAERTLGESALFLGALSHADALATMGAGDIFVLNSTYEGLSHVLIEALMLGKAVVATDAGGNSELIANEENGLLIPVQDTKALAEAITRLLTDPDLLRRLGEKGKEARERFSTARMLSHTKEILGTL